MIENPTVENGLLSRKPLRLQAWWALHRLTYFWRAQPDFLIVGVMKGGTTSLFRYLSQHPDVLPPFRKEIKYFDCNYFEGAAWYRAHFPLRQKFTGGSKLTGEATPYYIFHPTAHERVASAVPQAKIIIILRGLLPEQCVGMCPGPGPGLPHDETLGCELFDRDGCARDEWMIRGSDDDVRMITEDLVDDIESCRTATHDDEINGVIL